MASPGCASPPRQLQLRSAWLAIPRPNSHWSSADHVVVPEPISVAGGETRSHWLGLPRAGCALGRVRPVPGALELNPLTPAAGLAPPWLRPWLRNYSSLTRSCQSPEATAMSPVDKWRVQTMRCFSRIKREAPGSPEMACGSLHAGGRVEGAPLRGCALQSHRRHGEEPRWPGQAGREGGQGWGPRAEGLDELPVPPRPRGHLWTAVSICGLCDCSQP